MRFETDQLENKKSSDGSISSMSIQEFVFLVNLGETGHTMI